MTPDPPPGPEPGSPPAPPPGPPAIWRVESDGLTGEVREGLIDLLVAVVDGGASVGFLPPMAREEAGAFWAGVIQPGVLLFVAGYPGHAGAPGDAGAPRIVGTVQLHLVLRPNGRHRAEVAKLLVHPGARRAGTGRALMRTAESAARADGRTLLVLDTREGDVSNLLYRALGYREAGRIPRFCRSAGGGLDATVIYYKDLPETG